MKKPMEISDSKTPNLVKGIWYLFRQKMIELAKKL